MQTESEASSFRRDKQDRRSGDSRRSKSTPSRTASGINTILERMTQQDQKIAELSAAVVAKNMQSPDISLPAPRMQHARVPATQAAIENFFQPRLQPPHISPAPIKTAPPAPRKQPSRDMRVINHFSPLLAPVTALWC
jgi:hypothetical protein